MKFGRLTLTEAPKGAWVQCVCDCGTAKRARVDQLRAGVVKSCGCLLREKAAARIVARNTTHGMSASPEYRIWNAMRMRCTNPKSSQYDRYGARGVGVCARWQSFENFIADVGRRPAVGMSLDRINNDGNYEPGNVRWTTAKAQARNRRTSVRITHAGTTATIAEWAERTGLSQLCISERLRAGWTPERALTEPTKERH